MVCHRQGIEALPARLELVRQSPCDPKTFARAARDYFDREPPFALGAGGAALYWLTLGHGYEVTSLDVLGAYHSTLKAAEHFGIASETQEQIAKLVAQQPVDNFVRRILKNELNLR